MRFLTPRNSFSALDDAMDMFQPFNYGKCGQMKTDISETDKGYLFEVELAGYDKKDLDVTLDKGYLTISANREENREQEEKGYLFKERRTGKIERTFYVGEVDENSVSAKYDKGVLNIQLNKKEKADSQKKIDIND